MITLPQKHFKEVRARLVTQRMAETEEYEYETLATKFFELLYSQDKALALREEAEFLEVNISDLTGQS